MQVSLSGVETNYSSFQNRACPWVTESEESYTAAVVFSPGRGAGPDEQVEPWSAWPASASRWSLPSLPTLRVLHGEVSDLLKVMEEVCKSGIVQITKDLGMDFQAFGY